MPIVNLAFDGKDLSAQARVAYWKDVIGDHLADVDLRAAPDISPQMAFKGTLRVRSYPSATVADISSGNQIIDRTAERIRHARSEGVLFNIVYEGGCQISQNGRNASPRSGSLFLYDSSQPYCIRTSRDFRTSAIMIDRCRLERALGSIRHYTGREILSSTPAMQIALDYWIRLVKALDDLPDTTADQMIDAGIDIMAIALTSDAGAAADDDKPGDLVVARASTFVQTVFHRDDLNVQDIAMAAGVSVRRLQECLKIRSTTPLELLRRHRLNHALKRLHDPHSRGISITTIMSQCGFNDHAHFSRAFRREFGITPSEARRKIAAGSIYGGVMDA